MGKIWFATGNEHKRRELAEIFAIHDAAHVVNIPSDVGINFAPEETGSTFLENALIKARTLFAIVKEPVVADDSGLCVEALDGRPGVLSARYGNTVGKNLVDAEKNRLVLKELGNNPNRKAHFVCAMVLFLGDDRFFAVQETLEGEITCEKRGQGGFGYDPIFLIPELGCTVAELSPTKKNHLSHRAKAGATIGRVYDAVLLG
ncbi:MAG: RdgB/HAM1 family non-canonical purine NTP pyrophosphatase [Treponema sp.]|nr:RdgB/HAM1 family non-canonical purine NTP pyrophosphatase [Treponema sp.]